VKKQLKTSQNSVFENVEPETGKPAGFAGLLVGFLAGSCL
jgi:hypothetical protein